MQIKNAKIYTADGSKFALLAEEKMEDTNFSKDKIY
jgi:hypothetical protein